MSLLLNFLKHFSRSKAMPFVMPVQDRNQIVEKTIEIGVGQIFEQGVAPTSTKKSKASTAFVNHWVASSQAWNADDLNLLLSLALEELPQALESGCLARTSIIDFRELVKGPCVDNMIVQEIDINLQTGMLPYLIQRRSNGMALFGRDVFDIGQAIEVALLALGFSGSFIFRDVNHLEVWYVPVL